MTITFDLDGTIADLYNVDNWLERLRAEDATPYEEAMPLVNLSRLARKLNKLQAEGAILCVVSWGSKISTAEYLEAVRQAKLNWLARHLPSVRWDSIEIVSYGTPKSTACPYYDESAILFDDDKRNREEWGANGFSEDMIFEILSSL